LLFAVTAMSFFQSASLPLVEATFSVLKERTGD
jgi:hypothetical protein